jgi:peptidyl-prolyl cis-trans isomerase D
MLDLMRRKKRLKAILWVVIIGLGMGMLLFFVPGQNIGDGRAGNTVATVAGEPITVKEYLDAYRRIVKNFTRGDQSRIPPELIKQLGLDRQALNSLINVRVVCYAARRLGLEVSDQELRRAVETNPSFQYQGAFIGLEHYKALLAANQLDVAEFEEGLRSALLAEKLENMIVDSLAIPEEELRRAFLREEQEGQVRFALLKKEDFKKKVQPTEAELKAYFDAHKDRYATKEERRARYLLVARAALEPSIQVTDREVEARWAGKPHPDTVEIGRILLAVPDPAKEGEVKARAEAVVKRARALEDFAQLARKYSEDKTTAAQGGRLGPLTREQMDKEVGDAAFSLQPGQVSDPIRTQEGYEIIKLVKRETPDLKAKWNEVVAELRAEKAAELAREKSEEALRLLEKQKDLTSVAKSLGVPAEVRETPFFNRQSEPEALGISRAFIDEVFALKETNAFGKAVEVPAGHAIPQLLEIHLPRPGDFAQSRAAVASDFIDERARELMKAEAARLSEEAKRSGDLEKAARALGLAVIATKPFKRDASPAPEIASTEEFNEAAFELPVGAVSAPLRVRGDDEMAVLQVLSRTPFDEGAYSRKKAELQDRLVEQWRDAYFQAYVQRITEDLEKAGKIRINTALLNRLTGGGA